MGEHELAGLNEKINGKGFFERILAERDRTEAEREKRLNERAEAQQKAVDAALLAAKEAVGAAFEATKEAVNKAEAAQLRVNDTQNEFRSQLKDQNATTERTMMPRKETETLISQVLEKLEALGRDTRDRLDRIEKASAAYVDQDKYDDKLKAEATARDAALVRVNEKFDEYVKRYDQRQREVDLLLQAQQNTADEASRSSEKAAAMAKEAAAEQGRKNNRNIGIASVCLTAVIVTMNLIGAI